MRARLAILVALLGLGAFVGSAQAGANTITPMCTTAQGGPVQCLDGWYTTPVELQWAVSPVTASKSLACSEAPTFIADTNEFVECDASWTSPPDIQYPYHVRVEVSTPTATAALARPPDSNGWYNHPVALTMTGTYSYSGFASCTGPSYTGPSASNVTVSGTCTDNAGKTATADVPLNYDDTAPTITAASPARKPGSGGYYTRPVKFSFTGTDAMSGIASCQTVSYSGPASGSVVGGCWDRAGNYSSISVPVRYRRSAPRASVARVGSSLVLRWKAAPRASYYNVQIYRGQKKVLSTWPARTSLVLRRSWSFAGHRFRLKPGRYRWYVWPGYGSRAAARYGHKLVASTFTLNKRT